MPKHVDGDRVVCPECGGPAHRLGESDKRDDNGALKAARYVCHGEMNLRQIGDGDGDTFSWDGYPRGEFYADFRESRVEDGYRLISQELFGDI